MLEKDSDKRINSSKLKEKLEPMHLEKKFSSGELNEKGNAAFNKEEYQEAIQHYTEAMKFNPNDHNLYHNRSISYAKIGQFKDSLLDAEKAIILKRDWPKGYFRKGYALEQLKKYDEAIRAYEEGLTYNANNESLKAALKNCKDLFKSKIKSLNS